MTRIEEIEKHWDWLLDEMRLKDDINYLLRIAKAAEKLCEDIEFMYVDCPMQHYKELRKALEDE